MRLEPLGDAQQAERCPSLLSDPPGPFSGPYETDSPIKPIPLPSPLPSSCVRAVTGPFLDDGVRHARFAGTYEPLRLLSHRDGLRNACGRQGKEPRKTSRPSQLPKPPFQPHTKDTDNTFPPLATRFHRFFIYIRPALKGFSFRAGSRLAEKGCRGLRLSPVPLDAV